MPFIQTCGYRQTRAVEAVFPGQGMPSGNYAQVDSLDSSGVDCVVSVVCVLVDDNAGTASRHEKPQLRDIQNGLRTGSLFCYVVWIRSKNIPDKVRLVPFKGRSIPAFELHTSIRSNRAANLACSQQGIGFIVKADGVQSLVHREQCHCC
jgi:hypothetical protein